MLNSSPQSRLRALLACSVLFAAYQMLPNPARAATPADVLGPDGLLYPDWRMAGVPDGIPENLIVRTSVTSHGAVANDNGDDSAGFKAAVDYAKAQGGGVISIPAGAFYLDRPLLITASHIVFRGAGANLTKIYFRYAPPANGVSFFSPADQSNVTNNTLVEIHADPVNLESLAIKYNGKVIASSKINDDMRGAAFSLRTIGRNVLTATGAGAKQLIAEAKYVGQSTVETSVINVNVVSGADPNPYIVPDTPAAINFCGFGDTGPRTELAASALRGATSLNLVGPHGLAPGDRIILAAQNTQNWRDEVGTPSGSYFFRRYMFVVDSVNGNEIRLNQPLRIDYPLDPQGNPYVQKQQVIEGCGVENLYLEQTKNLWTCGVVFSNAWECWAKGVVVKKAGRHPIYCEAAKWCEIRDCVFDDAWWKGSGGSAYVGWEKTYDCLMENVTAHHMRHAPLFQWTAAGNVIRKSFFYNSDAQWHSGWTNENLLEQCVIESNLGNAGYGYGMYSSKVDSDHGPNGPRNVIYNNDVTSPSSGVWLGGQNKDWMFLHNRIAADEGVGLFARKGSGGHRIEGNVFALREGGNGVWLEDPDCTGVKVINNTFDGIPSSAAIAGGAVVPFLSGNAYQDLQYRFPFTNLGFENGFTGWSTSADNGMSSISGEAAHSGSAGLRIQDNSDSKGASVVSPAFPVSPGDVCVARFWARTITDANLLAQFAFYNSAGGAIGSTIYKVPAGTAAVWYKHCFKKTVPAGAVTVKFSFRTYGGQIVTGDFDDLELSVSPLEFPNGGFEEGLVWWNNSNDNGMSSAGGYGNAGTPALRVLDDSASLGASLVSSSVGARPGDTYQVRFSNKIVSGSRVSVSLDFLNGSGAVIATSTKTIPAPVVDWHQFVVRGDAPAGTAMLRVRIHSNAADLVTADFDEFVLNEIAPRPLPAVPSIFEWQRNMEAPFPLDNPGFENDLAGWANSGDNGMSTVSTVAPHSGTKCLRVVDNNEGANSSLRTIARYDVQPGKNYRATFWTRWISGSKIAVYIKFLDASGANVGEVYKVVPSTATDWTQLPCEGVAPAGAAQAYLWIHSYGGTTVTADFDDFEFFPVL